MLLLKGKRHQYLDGSTWLPSSLVLWKIKLFWLFSKKNVQSILDRIAVVERQVDETLTEMVDEEKKNFDELLKVQNCFFIWKLVFSQSYSLFLSVIQRLIEMFCDGQDLNFVRDCSSVTRRNFATLAQFKVFGQLWKAVLLFGKT